MALPPGVTQQGMNAVKVGMEALQKALPQLPLGSDIHTAVLKALESIGKHLDKGGAGQGDSSAQIQQRGEMMRSARRTPPPAMPPGGGDAPPAQPPQMAA